MADENHRTCFPDFSVPDENCDTSDFPFSEWITRMEYSGYHIKCNPEQMKKRSPKTGLLKHPEIFPERIKASVDQKRKIKKKKQLSQIKNKNSSREKKYRDFGQNTGRNRRGKQDSHIFADPVKIKISFFRKFRHPVLTHLIHSAVHPDCSPAENPE